MKKIILISVLVLLVVGFLSAPVATVEVKKEISSRYADIVVLTEEEIPSNLGEEFDRMFEEVDEYFADLAEYFGFEIEELKAKEVRVIIMLEEELQRKFWEYSGHKKEIFSFYYPPNKTVYLTPRYITPKYLHNSSLLYHELVHYFFHRYEEKIVSRIARSLVLGVKGNKK